MKAMITWALLMTVWTIITTSLVIQHDNWIKNHEKTKAATYTVYFKGGCFDIHLASDREAINIGEKSIYRITSDGIVIWGKHESE